VVLILIEISDNSDISFIIQNNKNEFAKTDYRSFTKTTLQKASKIRKTKPYIANIKIKFNR